MNPRRKKNTCHDQPLQSNPLFGSPLATVTADKDPLHDDEDFNDEDVETDIAGGE